MTRKIFGYRVRTIIPIGVLVALHFAGMHGWYFILGMFLVVMWEFSTSVTEEIAALRHDIKEGKL